MMVDGLDAKIVRFFTDAPRCFCAGGLPGAQGRPRHRAVAAGPDAEGGVIGSWVPHPDPSHFGFPVVAFCSLTINQDLGHDAVVEALAEIPELIEIHTVSGSSDLMARIAARSNPDLQRVLDAMIATRTVLRSSSVIVLNTHFQGRTLPLLEAEAARTRR